MLPWFGMGWSGLIFWFLSLLGIILVTIYGARALNRFSMGRDDLPSPNAISPLDIPDQCYARAEINKEEFVAVEKDLLS
ncbi:MAG: hypothetical protein GTO18_13410 [Anaerolineales bacterium]|nr:hypothetical protein [Anaerolineales bacterium]